MFLDILKSCRLVLLRPLKLFHRILEFHAFYIFCKVVFVLDGYMGACAAFTARCVLCCSRGRHESRPRLLSYVQCQSRRSDAVNGNTGHIFHQILSVNVSEVTMINVAISSLLWKHICLKAHGVLW